MGAVSARGLFRATGNNSKPTVQMQLDGTLARVDGSLEREKDDFYPTPPEPTLALLAAEGRRLADFPVIWEPAAGDGAMVRLIQEHGHRCVGTDLIDRGAGFQVCSFYDFNTAQGTAIVTNPPFAECNRDPGWVRHALENLGVEYMALLLPVNWMGSGTERAALWGQYTPARVYLMRWRIDFTGQGAPPMLNAWFVWDKQHKGETVLRMLDRKDARQSELFAAESAA